MKMRLQKAYGSIVALFGKQLKSDAYLLLLLVFWISNYAIFFCSTVHLGGTGAEENHDTQLPRSTCKEKERACVQEKNLKKKIVKINQSFSYNKHDGKRRPWCPLNKKKKSYDRPKIYV